MINFQLLAEKAEALHWQDAVSEHINPATAYEWSVSDHQAACLLQALPASAKCALDANCGSGTYSLALASLCEKVYATSPDRHAVRFVRQRAKQEGIHNLQTCIGPPVEMFEPESMDLIVVPPHTDMKQFDSLISLLKPTGRLCLAVQNTRRPFGKISTGFTRRKLRAMLIQSGLSSPRIFACYPDITNIHYLIDTQNPRGVGALLETRLPRASRSSLLRRCIHWVFSEFLTAGYWAYGTRIAE